MDGRGETLLIRVDAETRMGTGHVMRCVALAQAWEEEGGRAVFATAVLTPALENRLRAEGFEPTMLEVSPGSEEDAAKTVEAARRVEAAGMVVDGYHFDTDYHRAIKAAGYKLLVIDDYGHADRYLADLVLNQNVHAEEALYRKREPHTRLLLGTRYALLRREFWTWRGWKREIPPVASRLLVTLGGSDPDNVTRRVLEAVGRLEFEGLQTTVLVGGSNPHRASLETAARRGSRPIRLESDVADMPRWMKWADVAVTAAGGTLWELAFFAVPSLTVILAENQQPAASRLAEQGVFPTLGWGVDLSGEIIRDHLRPLLLSSELRRRHSERASQLVDGKGAFRVVEALRKLNEASP